MLRLIGILLLIPLLDAILLLVLTQFIGWEVVVLLVVLTALVGMLLVRAESRHTMRKIQRKAAQGEVPTDELVDGGLLLIAGAFLLTPGLVTDLLGFAIVIPVTRWPIRWALKRFVLRPYVDAKTGGFATGGIYVGGFPGGDGGDGGPGDQGPVGGSGGPGRPGGPGGPGSPGGQGGSPGGGPAGHEGTDTVDLGEDAYDVDVEDEDERSG